MQFPHNTPPRRPSTPHHASYHGPAALPPSFTRTADRSPACPSPRCRSPWAVPQPVDKRPRLDPKELAKQKAAETRQAAKAAKLAKEASGMRKLSAFFRPAAQK